MTEQFEELLSQIELPDDAVVDGEKDDRVEAKFHLDAASKGLDVVVMIFQAYAKIEGTQNYGFEVDEEKSGLFQEEMAAAYPSYRIFGSGQALKVNFRASYDTPEELTKSISDYIKVAADAAEKFEKECVDFFSSGAEEKDEEYSTAVKTVARSDVDKADAAEIFAREQKEECQKAISRMVEENNGSVSDDGTGTFPYHDGEVSMSPQGFSLLTEYRVEMPEKKGIIAVANVKDQGIAMSTEYKDGKACFGSYFLPNKYDESLTGKYIESFTSDCDKAISEISDELWNPDPITVAKDMQKLLDQQMEEAKRQAELVEEKFRELQEKEKAFEEEKARIKEEQDSMVQQVRDRMKALAEKEQRLADREQDLEDQANSFDTEKSRYVMQVQSMASEIAKLKAASPGLEGPQGSVDDKEYARMKAELDALIASRVVMERTLGSQIEDLRKTNKTLREDLSEREREVAEYRDNLEAQAAQLFGKKEDAYKEKIAALEEKAGAVGDVLTPESVIGALKKEFPDARKDKGKNYDIVSFTLGDIQFKVLFADPVIIDAFQHKRYSDKSLLELNEKESGVKFFRRNEDQKKKDGGITVARAYVSRTAQASKVAAMANVLGDYFLP